MTIAAIWFRINGGDWNNSPSANPVTGVGGYDVSGMAGPYFPAAYISTGFTGGIPLAINFGPDFAQTPPAGFAAWGAGTVINELDKNSNVTLSIDRLSMSVGGETTGAGARATTSSATETGPRYFEYSWQSGLQDANAGLANASAALTIAFGDQAPAEWAVFQPSLGPSNSATAINGAIYSNAFPEAVAGDVICVALGVMAGPATPSLNLGPVTVTSLAAESPCTVAEYATPPGVSPAMGLRWSDTRGATFGNPVAQALGTDPLTQLQWNRTGYARDRVFELFWSAAAKTALNGAFVIIDPWGS